ncbi:MAG: serine hydrolase domain-containing protein [Opitutaceae bacterium]|nr:serine hydrolase domain-containing protein [Opitutaceae bacterium]
MNPPVAPDSAWTRRHWLKTVALSAVAGACRRSVAAAPNSARAPVVAVSDAHRKAWRAVIEDAITRKAIPGGALVVLSHGHVVFREAFGTAAFDSARPFTVDAPCFIASLTKPISATFMVMLHERGVISLDDPVDKYLPEFKGIRLKGAAPAAAMRVWHLLSHRSGLPGNADPGDLQPPTMATAERFSLADAVAHYLEGGLLAEPGARFSYGHSGYMVAARIAEVVLGQRYERLLEENLLHPLGMMHTTFFPEPATLAAAPTRYLPSPAGPTRDTRVMPLPRRGGLINPAGGLCSRLDDMAAFVALHLNRGRAADKPLIAASQLARMYRPHPPRATETAEGGGTGYGLGWNVIAAGKIVRHLGASGTLAWLDLEHQHAGVLLTQVKWGAGNRPLIPRLMKEVQTSFAGPAESARNSGSRD